MRCIKQIKIRAEYHDILQMPRRCFVWHGFPEALRPGLWKTCLIFRQLFHMYPEKTGFVFTLLLTGLKLENYYFFTFTFSWPEVGKSFHIYFFTFSLSWPEVGKLFHIYFFTFSWTEVGKLLLIYFYFFLTWSWKIIPYLLFYFFFVLTWSWKIIPYLLLYFFSNWSWKVITYLLIYLF